MKLEGMDAAIKTVNVQAAYHDLFQGKPEQFNDVRQKGAALKERPGYTLVLLKNSFDTPEIEGFLAKAPREDNENSGKVIRDVIDRANRVLTGSDRKFEITTHEKTREILIKVVDTKTNETIREIPPKKIVDLVVCLCEMAGILYDEKG